MIDQLNEYVLGHLLEREGVQYASPAFLDQVDGLATSGTCSFAAVVFMTNMGIRTLSFSNLLSISTAPT